MSSPATREQLKDWCFQNKYTKWYHDPINNVERYFLIDSQPINFKEGRLRRVYSN